MKKFIFLFAIIITFGFIASPTYAAETPEYDKSFNNNAGAFYANGVPIVISEVEGNTVITWDGGSQIVPNTVSIFGGGNGGIYDSSQITMESGTVQNLVAGGIGFTSDKSSTVNNATLIINGGKISNAVTGGGYFNAKVNNSNIELNGGTALTVQGGGMASGKISGIDYSVGNKDDMINSPNRTDVTNLIISGGKISSLLFGGGQGISYTDISNLTIHDVEMNNGYITAGGSNGYTETSNVKILGGNIGVYQTVNRGFLNNATIKIAGSSIKKFYVGGETEDKSVTGILNNINTNLISGKIESLNNGTSDGIVLEIDNTKYKVNLTKDIKIDNDNIGSSENIIDYSLSIPSKDVSLFVKQNIKITPIIFTTPSGYENIFSDLIYYVSNDPSIATVSEDGTITGISEGSTFITVKNGEKSEIVNVTVKTLRNTNIMILIILLYTLALLIFLYFIFIR